MKKPIITLVSIMLIAAACGNKGKHAGDKDSMKGDSNKTAKNEEPAKPMDSAAMMKAWMDYVTPGEMHKWMASNDGEWNAEVTSYDESGKESKSTGKMVNSMMFNGLYQQQKYTGSMMGMPFEGMGTLAYDNAEKMFHSSWCDNMGSGIMYMKGTMDPATKTLTTTGEMADPMDGKKMCKYRETLEVMDDNTQMMNLYCTRQGGKEQKMVSMKLTRGATPAPKSKKS